MTAEAGESNTGIAKKRNSREGFDGESRKRKPLLFFCAKNRGKSEQLFFVEPEILNLRFCSLKNRVEA
jgi:hypothetical protein